MKSIYNAISNSNSNSKKTRMAMQQVLKLLGENHYVEHHRRHPQSNEVLSIFWDQTLNEINASFEMSLNIAKHEHKNETLLDVLMHVISHKALGLLFEEIGRSKSVGFDPEVCSCLHRHTLGLPCAHEIKEYRRQSRPIPIDVVDQRWRQFSIMPMVKSDNDLFSLPQVKLLHARWCASLPAERESIELKIQEIANPVTTRMHEPSVVSNAKGRPQTRLSSSQKKRMESTKRDPSFFEHVERSLEQAQSTKRKNKLTVRRKKHKNDMPSEGYLGVYIEGFLPEIRSYIWSIDDVPKDGHCGFHVLARHLGYSDKEGWRQVRVELYEELESRLSFYTSMLSQEYVGDLLTMIPCTDTVTGEEHYMSIPAAAYLFANRYKIPLVLLSENINNTFFPMCAPPAEHKLCNLCTMGHIGNHFVIPRLIGHSPIPPPSTIWYKHAPDVAIAWMSPFTEKINLYKKLLKMEEPRDMPVGHFDVQID